MQTFTGFVADAFVYHHVRYHKIMKVTINRLKVATLQKQRQEKKAAKSESTEGRYLRNFMVFKVWVLSPKPVDLCE